MLRCKIKFLNFNKYYNFKFFKNLVNTGKYQHKKLSLKNKILVMIKFIIVNLINLIILL